MVESKAIYVGGLHCELTHGPSGSSIETDAPKDNQGKGERFSPTDLVAAAFNSCVLTTMAIVAEREGVVLKNTKGTVQKIMTSSPPRKIQELKLKIEFCPGIPQPIRAKLEATANGCPVHRSLSAEMQKTIEFIYPD